MIRGTVPKCWILTFCFVSKKSERIQRQKSMLPHAYFKIKFNDYLKQSNIRKNERFILYYYKKCLNRPLRLNWEIITNKRLIIFGISKLYWWSLCYWCTYGTWSSSQQSLPKNWPWPDRRRRSISKTFLSIDSSKRLTSEFSIWLLRP